MSDPSFPPLPGSAIFNALKDERTIILAANTRTVPGVARGILRAAKDLDAPLLFELARSESNLEGGYTGLTPSDYARRLGEVAEDVGHDIWGLHADHITVKKGDAADIEATKALIDAQVDAGYTSFAIDASHLFDFEGGNLREELAHNIDVTTELARHVESRMGGRPFGLEVEVGEIGKTDQAGMVITRPEEAVTFISALQENGIHPNVLAIANGTAHGNIYDENGNLMEQVSINIPQTRAVAQALKDAGLGVRIAQHGITGTPRQLIYTDFPHGDIIKGNVATFWQNLVWEILKVHEPDLYKRVWSWTMETQGSKMPGKRDQEIFGKLSKFAIKQHFDEIYSVSEDTNRAIEAMAYAEALTFFKAFRAKGMAEKVRKAL